jgi:hypothetical protein
VRERVKRRCAPFDTFGTGGSLAATGNHARRTAYAYVAAVSLAACATKKARNPGPELGAYAYLYGQDIRRKAENELARECPTLAFGTHDGYPIHLDDGVSRCEAFALAIYYFRKGHFGCGGPGAPVEEASYWLVPMQLGVAGTAALPIQIDKVSGRGRLLYADGQPSFAPVRSVEPRGGPL